MNFFCCFFCSMSQQAECENAALRQCVQARAQLEEAIAGVIKAEAQLRGNSREVRGFKHVLNPLLCVHYNPFIMPSLSVKLLLPHCFWQCVQRLFWFLIWRCSTSVLFFKRNSSVTSVIFCAFCCKPCCLGLYPGSLANPLCFQLEKGGIFIWSTQQMTW